ncbi:MAG: hypothetical protein ACFFB3_21675 [Candidatus Hodarchaeota archaeon]
MWLINLKQHGPKMGEAVVVVWKKEDGTACGGTEGFVLGVAGDEVSGEYLVLDRSTYQDSFKSNILSLGILDLKVIPMKCVEMLEKTDMRRRPPWSYEKITMKMEANYKSNIDFKATMLTVQKRTDCTVDIPPKNGSEADYETEFTIREIRGIGEMTSITIYSTGTLQIRCKHEQLREVLRWIREAVDLLPDHKRLVLFTVGHKYTIWDTYKEDAHPTQEFIDRIAKAEEGPYTAIFPIGWMHYFFVELDENPLQKFFPCCQPLENFVMKDKSKEKNAVKYLPISDETESKNSVDLQFPRSGVDATEYLGAVSPIIRLRSIIEDSSPKYEEYLIRAWLGMRSAPWQWFSSDSLSGKMIVRDLNIDKKARIWTLDLRKYSSSAEFLGNVENVNPPRE